MPSTEQLSAPPKNEPSTPTFTKPKARDEAQQHLLDVSDTLLDEIDEVLEKVTPPEPTTWTLGDLMREGSLMAPQAFREWKKPTGETCALQAVVEAARAKGLMK